MYFYNTQLLKGAEEKEVKFNDVLDHKDISSVSEASSVHKNESNGVEI